jgi:thiamine-phosphate pyrophosphorylase
MARTELRGLYAVTPDCADGARLLADVEAALAGGCRLVQYRDKLSAMPEQVNRARALRALTRRFGATLLINDDLAILGPGKILGASCYADFAAGQAAARAGADYIAFGAAYPSPTKPQAANATVGLFFRAKSEIGVPVCAIGGIALDNAAPLIAAGVDLLAVITDLFSAPDIAARAAQYQRLFERAQP